MFLVDNNECDKVYVEFSDYSMLYVFFESLYH